MFFATKTTCAVLPSMCNNAIQKYKNIIAAGYGGRVFLMAAHGAFKNVRAMCCKDYTRVWNTCGSHWWSIFEKDSKQLNSCDRLPSRQNNEEKLGVKPSLDHVSKIEDDNDEFQSHVNHDASGKKSDDEIETVNGERRMANGKWRTANGEWRMENFWELYRIPKEETSPKSKTATGKDQIWNERTNK